MRWMLLLLIPLNLQAAIRGGYLIETANPPPGARSVYPELNIWHVNEISTLAADTINYPNTDIHLDDEPILIQPWEPVPIDWNLQWTQARQAQKVSTGRGIRIAVLDSGVNNNPELGGRVLYSQGYDFVNEKVEARDDRGHGTQVATLAAGRTLGVAPEALIIPIKFLDKNGVGSLADTLRAFRWAMEKNAQVINASWGNPSWSWRLYDVVYKASENSVVVAAAGNQGRDLKDSPNYPASYNFSGVVSVGSSDVRDHLSGFSNYGKKVYMAAPGQGVRTLNLEDQEIEVNGTSFAAPAVSGAVALILAKNSNLTPYQVKKCLEYVDRPPLNVKTRGRLNVLRSLQKCL